MAGLLERILDRFGSAEGGGPVSRIGGLISLLLRLAECWSQLESGTKTAMGGRAVDTLRDLLHGTCLKETVADIPPEDRSRLFRLMAMASGSPQDAVVLEYAACPLPTSVAANHEVIRDAEAWAIKQGTSRAVLDVVKEQAAEATSEAD